MNEDEVRCVKALQHVIKLIKRGKVTVTSTEIENDVEMLTDPGTTKLFPSYTGQHILTVLWIDKPGVGQ